MDSEDVQPTLKDRCSDWIIDQRLLTPIADSDDVGTAKANSKTA